jgi:hypothetical protein
MDQSTVNLDSARSARDVRIDKLEIASFSASGTDVVDLKYITEQIDIFESIFEPKISGTIAIRDGVNVIASLPIVGQEKLTIKWRSATLSDWVEKDFFVYKVGQRQYFPNHSEMFGLSFVSNEHKTNSFSSVSQYYNATYDTIVKSVMTSSDYINTKKTVDVEETNRTVEIVTPHWKPYAFMNWMAARAVSKENNSSSYMFYETLDGFHFRSIASLLPKPVKQTYIVQYQNTAVSNMTSQQWIDQFRSTEFYSMSESFDTLANIQEGMFSSEMLVYDVVTRTVKTTQYDYSKSFVDHPHMYANKLYAEVDRFEDKYVGKYQSYRNFLVTSSQSHNGVVGYFPEEWRLQRQSYLRQLLSVPLTITVPGDSSRRVGDMIEFTFPSPETPKDGEVQTDKYLTGKYLVTEIHHIIKHDDYRMQLTLHKDSLFTKLALSDRSVLTVEKELDTQVTQVTSV